MDIVLSCPPFMREATPNFSMQRTAHKAAPPLTSSEGVTTAGDKGFFI